MKTFLKTITIAIVLLLTSCSQDDPENSGSRSNNNEVTIMCCPIDTPNAYLILDDGPNFTNAFNLVFTNGTLREDNFSGIGFSTNMTQIVWLHRDFSAGTVTPESTVTNAITNTTHPLSDEYGTEINISNFTNTYMHNGQQYGEIDDTGASGFSSGPTSVGSLNITNFTVDLVLRTGTVDCDYTYVDANNITINGHYDGTFDIINEF